MSREFKNVLVVQVPQEETVENPTAALKMGLALAQEGSAFVTRSASCLPSQPGSPSASSPTHLLG